tara:strand:- start:126825 stop:127967 length:1143 start_codon:yes stop_codon:yes gene_type:complete
MKHSIIAGLLSLVVAAPVWAQVKIGVVLSTTGPAASLGIPERDAVSLMPTKVGDYDVEYLFLDDASDTTAARRNVERLVTEEKVDAIIGASTSPNSIAMIEVAGRSKTPMVSLGAALSIISPMDDNRRWVFKTPYNDSATAGATVKALLESGVKRIGFIGFNDAYGESWLTELRKAVEPAGPELVAVERFHRTDTSVTAQVLKVMTAKPDAVVVVASGTPAVLPQATLRERGFKGDIYQTSGVTNADFIRVGGEAVEGTLAAAASVTVAEELPEDHPAKKPAMAFLERWGTKFDKDQLSAFSGYAWDAYLLLEDALSRVDSSLKPGTEAFRSALRDNIESTKNLPTTNGIVNMSPADHNGYSDDAPVMITVKDGRWRLAK